MIGQILKLLPVILTIIAKLLSLLPKADQDQATKGQRKEIDRITDEVKEELERKVEEIIESHRGKIENVASKKPSKEFLERQKRLDELEGKLLESEVNKPPKVDEHEGSFTYQDRKEKLQSLLDAQRKRLEERGVKPPS